MTSVQHASNRSAAGQRDLAADVERYLALKKPTLVLHKDREYDLRSWLPKFGHRHRHTLEPQELQLQMNEWRTGLDILGKPVITGWDHRHQPVSKALAARTCNLRRTALSNLFTVLDGKRARNPVADVARFRLPIDLPQGYEDEVVDATFAEMSESKAKARAKLTMYAGFRPSEVMRARPEDVLPYINSSEPCCIKRVGKNGRPLKIELPIQAVEAWRWPTQRNVWGGYSQSNVNRDWKAAMVRAGAKAIERALQEGADPERLQAIQIAYAPRKMYALRHTFATKLTEETDDLSLVQDALGHRDIRTTRVYTQVVRNKRLSSLVRRTFDSAAKKEALS
jgi:site-specific recombinase XerC